MGPIEHFANKHSTRSASAAGTANSGDFVNGRQGVLGDTVFDAFFADTEASADDSLARGVLCEPALAKVGEDGMNAFQNNSKTLPPFGWELAADNTLDEDHEVLIGKPVQFRKRFVHQVSGNNVGRSDKKATAVRAVGEVDLSSGFGQFKMYERTALEARGRPLCIRAGEFPGVSGLGGDLIHLIRINGHSNFTLRSAVRNVKDGAL